MWIEEEEEEEEGAGGRSKERHSRIENEASWFSAAAAAAASTTTEPGVPTRCGERGRGRRNGEGEARILSPILPAVFGIYHTAFTLKSGGGGLAE